MALNCGIIGLTNTGKTTIFNCISNTKADIGGFATKTNIGMCEVRDERLKLIVFSAGAMLYVVVEELIPETQQGKHSDIGTIAFAIGFVVMMILDVALG